MKCTSGQKAIAVVTAGFFTICIASFAVGYIIPTVRYNNYNLRLCYCQWTNITGSGPYTGQIHLTYNLLAKTIDVITSGSLQVVNSYLQANNYRANLYVPCFVSVDDIEISMLTNVPIMIICIVSLVLFILSLMMLIYLTVRQRKRDQYVDLDEVFVSQPSNFERKE